MLESNPIGPSRVLMLAVLTFVIMCANALGVIRNLGLATPMVSEIPLLISFENILLRVVWFSFFSVGFGIPMQWMVSNFGDGRSVVLRSALVALVLVTIWIFAFAKAGLQYQGTKVVVLTILANAVLATLCILVVRCPTSDRLAVNASLGVLATWIFGVAFPWFGETP